MVGRIEGRVKEKRVPKFKKRYKWRFIGDILDGRRRRHRREFEIDYWTGSKRTRQFIGSSMNDDALIASSYL